MNLLLCFSLAVVCSCWYAVAEQRNLHDAKPYGVGEPFHVQCKKPDGEWGPGPICKETGEEITFFFGVDVFQHCGWFVDSPNTYLYYARLVNQQEHLACRVSVFPEHEFYIPFTIPLWGVVEADHMHINNHFNTIFHAADGRIIAVTTYPVMDAFQLCAVKTILGLHGPVKWFRAHSFKELSYSGGLRLDALTASGGANFIVVLWCFVTFLLTLLMASAMYRFLLKPHLMRKYLKND